MRSHAIHAVLLSFLVGAVAVAAPGCGAIRRGSAHGRVRTFHRCEDAAVIEGPGRQLIVDGCGRQATYHCTYGYRYCVNLAAHARDRHGTINRCSVQSVEVVEVEPRTFVTRGCGRAALQRCAISARHGTVRCELQPYVPPG